MIQVNSIPIGLELSPLARDDIVLQLTNGGRSAKVAIAQNGRDLMLHAKDKTRQCNTLLKIPNSKPAYIHKTLTLDSMNPYKDNYYSLVIQTSLAHLKKDQTCQVLVGKSYPVNSLAPDVAVQMRSSTFTLTKDGKVKLDFKVLKHGVYVQSLIAKEPSRTEVRRETLLVIVPLTTFGIEDPYTVSLQTVFL